MSSGYHCGYELWMTLWCDNAMATNAILEFLISSF